MKEITLMCRVSSDEQIKGFSLDNQRERLTEYCQRIGVNVAYTIMEDHSAKNFERPEFQKWLKLVKRKKIKTDGLIVMTWDRFSRDLTGGLNMVKELRKLGVTPQAINQPIDLDIPDQLIMLAVYMAAPDVDNQKRSKAIRGGIRAGLSLGYYPMKPMYGFKSGRNGTGKHILVHHETQAPIVHEIFTKVAAGIGQSEIRADLAERGIKMARNTMHRILKRVIYAGKVVVPADKDTPMQLVQGRHKPIISQALYLKAQRVLTDNLKQKNKQDLSQYALLRDDFYLRGLINCCGCGHPMTSSYSRGRHGKRFGYYHCQHKPCTDKQRASAKKIHAGFEQLMASVQIETPILELYEAILANSMGVSKDQNKIKIDALKRQIAEIEQDIVKVQNLMVKGQLSVEDYTQIKVRYAAQIDDHTSEIKRLNTSNIEFVKLTRQGLNILTNIVETFTTATIEVKRKIWGSIFDENLIFCKNNYRTPKLNKIFSLIARFDAALSQIESGTNGAKLPVVPLCGETGIRTPGTRLEYACLANKSFRPLRHLTNFLFLKGILQSFSPFYLRLQIYKFNTTAQVLK